MSVKSRKKKREQKMGQGGGSTSGFHMSEGTWNLLQVGGIILLVLAVLMSLMLSTAAVMASKKDHTAIAASASDERTKAAFNGQNFFTLWISGDKSSIDSFNSMSTVTLPEVGSNPAQVSDINVFSALPAEDAHLPDGDTLWNVRLGASVSTLGSTDLSRNFYLVTLREHDGKFKATKLPEMINDEQNDFTVESPFQGTVKTSDPAGVAVSKFVEAYYTQNGSDGVGSFATPAFFNRPNANPIKNTPYTAVEIDKIRTKSSGGLTNVKTGKTGEVMVTFKLSSTSTSFVYSSVMLKLKRIEDNQWQVDEILDSAPNGELRDAD